MAGEREGGWLVHDNRELRLGAGAAADAGAVERSPSGRESESGESGARGGGPLAVVLLNADREPALVMERLWPAPLLARLWRRAHIAVCADGAANTLLDVRAALPLRAPHAVVGDLDSLRDDVAARLAAEGSLIVKVPDEDTHDMHKALEWVRSTWAGETGAQAGEAQAQEQERAHTPALEQPRPITVVAVGAFGGRLDQEMANINMLFTWAAEPRFARLLLMGKHSVAFALGPGRHRIICDRELESGGCGLIPIFAPCARVTTRGLRWDLQESELRFGGLVSSSNEVMDDEVWITTDQPLLWTANLR
jgi:thiamine pyrophosphokinase